MKSSFVFDQNTGKMRSEVENILPSPEVKTARKSRDRGRSTKQDEDTMKGHRPMKQVTLHTETSNECVVTDATGAKNPEQTKQKDNMEVNQIETPELAQNKTMDKERADRAAKENIGEDEKTENKQEGVPESSSEDKANETQTTEAEAANNIKTMLQSVRAHKKCSCEKCSECRLENQGFKHKAASNMKRMVKEIQWPDEIKQMMLVFGHEQEVIKEGRVKARGHLAKVKLGACQVKFEHEGQQQDEITVLEDASGLIYGVQQRNQDCKFEEMVKIRLVSKKEVITAVLHASKGHEGESQ